MSAQTDPLKIHAAARVAISAVMEQPVSLQEAHAALTAAQFIVHQAIEAQNKATLFDRVLKSIRGQP